MSAKIKIVILPMFVLHLQSSAPIFIRFNTKITFGRPISYCLLLIVISELLLIQDGGGFEMAPLATVVRSKPSKLCALKLVGCKMVQIHDPNKCEPCAFLSWELYVCNIHCTGFSN